MASLNKVMLIGNAGKDAELRYLANGTAQAKFSLAVNRNFKAADGEWKEETEWFNIVVWAALAERISQSVTKGKQLYVEGRLSTRSWDDDQGVKHYMTEVIAQDLKILERREAGQGGGSGDWGDGSARQPRRQGGYSAPGAGADAGGDVDVDDLPFE
ncbi:MAG: single-stranded DNA-binding protein [Anaerolinea sp.]|nr:single-stranded DNA-binding protein [Anaerolinea sp.]